MHPKLFRLPLIVLSLGILHCLLNIVNVMISLKYETKLNDCISTVTGRDLCFELNCYQFGVPVLFAILVTLSIREKKIVKPCQQ